MMAEEGPTETNHYMNTVSAAKSKVEDCKTAVHEGAGSPADSIATAVSSGGWVCDTATEWVAELSSHCANIMPAFETAADDLDAEYKREDVNNNPTPAGDPHGNAWLRTWAWRNKMI